MADESAKVDPLRVDASPTKGFFVDIITRDIALGEAIEDLVDNCVDGAKRLRPKEGDNYNGLWIKISISGTSFSIEDNCGGIDRATAQTYAFKFGRAKGFTETPFSVGQFGIGMKRALFKFGSHFTVHSVEPNTSFDIEVDVDKWIDDTDWDFKLNNLVTTPNAIENTGTKIVVDRLFPSVSKTFSEGLFQTNLRQTIRVSQQHFMRAGLKIHFNGEEIIPTQWQLRNGDGIEPSFKRFEDDLGGAAKLKTRIYAGVGDSSTAHAGWYIFCNGRCVLAADQSEVTGWKASGEVAAIIPKYHGQFARFRGYAFLECQDASILPWNTTKTGLDLEAAAYRLLQGRLVDAMRPVINFLNELDNETDLEVEDRNLNRALSSAALTPLERLPERAAFTYRGAVKRGPALVSIAFKKSQPRADKLKKALDAASYKHLGEKLFENAYEELIEDDQ